MRPFEIRHADPVPVARAAAVRTHAERDELSRAEQHPGTPAECLRRGFELSRFAARLRAGRR